MSIKELQAEIDALKKRVAELEARPPAVHYHYHYCYTNPYLQPYPQPQFPLYPVVTGGGIGGTT
jgi:hypothetical protein